MSPRNRSQSGFTLLEVIVAITLAAMAALLGAMVLRMGGDFYERAHTYLREQQELRGTLRVLRQEMQSVPKGAAGLRGNAMQVDLLSEKPPLSSGRQKQTLISIGCMEVATGRFALVHLMRLEAGQSSQLAESRLKAELAQVASLPGTPAALPLPPLVVDTGSTEPVYE
ncbi:MAG: prepilin-type N-terminal cleavage/methylation domain-containing protein, partial [Sulfuricella sp.]|nr:prepilin-type N-terminal cleavage/methylation domain-containing protein [Sulfuricella sp.]